MENRKALQNVLQGVFRNFLQNSWTFLSGMLIDQGRAASVKAIADGDLILVDAAPGSARGTDLLNLPLEHLGAIFLTHFHSDHIADTGEVNFLSWANGRTEPLKIYGPQGVDRVVQGFIQSYELDSSYRVAHHGEDVMPPSAAVPTWETLSIESATSSTLFFDKNGLKVYAFMVDHRPAEPAVGYRFEYKGNVVVFTGDTKKIDSLSVHAQGADILISNGLSYYLTEKMSQIATEMNRPRMSKILTDVQDYQMDPIHAAEVARDAGAKKLVFNHIVPPLPNILAEGIFLNGISDIYQGEVILGKDGMMFSLDPKQ